MKIFNRFFLLSLLIITSCKTQFVATSNDKQLYKVTSTTQNDSISELDAYLKPFRDSLNITMNEVIGEAMGDFVKEKPSGSLGNLVVDAMLWQITNEELRITNEKTQKENTSNADNRQPSTDNIKCSGAITNPGGLRINQIPKGKITQGKIFELLPFENELVIVEVDGKILKQWIKLSNEKGGWPFQFPGFDFYETGNFGCMEKFTEIDPIYKDTIIGLRAVDCNKADSTFYIATNDYVANGGDNCSFLIPCKKYPTGKTIRELVIAYIKSEQKIYPNKNVIHFGQY